MLGPVMSDKITLRPLSSERSLLTKCDGSARVRQGKSSALVGIWGPVDVRVNREDPEKAVVETTVKGRNRPNQEIPLSDWMITSHMT